jgi:hypothetical protein
MDAARRRFEPEELLELIHDNQQILCLRHSRLTDRLHKSKSTSPQRHFQNSRLHGCIPLRRTQEIRTAQSDSEVVNRIIAGSKDGNAPA